MSILYLGPISLVAWYGGRASGFLVAVTSALMWLLADFATGHEFGHFLVEVLERGSDSGRVPGCGRDCPKTPGRP